MRRRELLGLAGALALSAKKAPVIILRSGWQTVNIGDIAHTPGVLRLIDKHVPGARVILWSTSVDRGVDSMLKRNFPSLRIVPAAQAAEYEEADFFLHGSGPSVVGREQLAAWRKAVKKPYGIFGVTITKQSEAASAQLDAPLKEMLDGARFVYTRETISLENLRTSGVKAARIEFVPDGAFSFDLRDDGKASQFLQTNKLEHGKFLVAIPRLRYTPYHKTRPVNWTEAEIKRRTEVNDKHAEADHAKLREAIVAYVRKTGGKALLCPEMTYELDLIGPLLYEPLPEDVKKNVVRRTEYWLPDEAASTYRHAAAVMSCECHSPILAAAQGTPCMYVHQPEDGIKGQMWKDVGLGEWYFDVDSATGAQIAETVLRMAAAPDAARRKVRAAVDGAHKRQADGMRAVVAAIGAVDA